MTGETGMGLDEAEEDNATSATSADLRQWESLDVAHQQNKAASQLLVLSVEYTPGLNDSSKSDRPKVINNMVSNTASLESLQLNLLRPGDSPVFVKGLENQGSSLSRDSQLKKNTTVPSTQVGLVLLKGQICAPNKSGIHHFSKYGVDSYLENDVLIVPLPETVVNTNYSQGMFENSSSSTRKVFGEKPLIIPYVDTSSSPEINGKIGKPCEDIPNNKKDEDTHSILKEALQGHSSPLSEESHLRETVSGDLDLNIDDVELTETICDVGWESDSSSDDALIQKVIADKPVICRARASLPANFLYIDIVNDSFTDTVGVFAQEIIPKRSRFGPVEGVLLEKPKINAKISPVSTLELIVEVDNKKMLRLDVSNENLSNWMCYVRPAKNVKEQNLVLSQIGKNLFYTTTRIISAKEELKVWYSIPYATARSLPLLLDTDTLSRSVDTGLSCQECGIRFTGKNILQKHLAVHSKVNYNLRPHQKKMGNERLGTYESERKLFCSHCQLSFGTASLLNLHMLTHAADDLETCCKSEGVMFKYSEVEDDNLLEKEKKFNCTICSKHFSTKSALACHVKSHSDDKKIECPICNKIFDKVLGLKSHIHTHLSNGYYPCSHCSKKFPEYKHVRKHIRSFHCARNHKCSTCSKRFITLDKLRMHELSHSDLKQFLCANCGKQFKRKDKLSDHMKKIHYPGKEKQATPPRSKLPKKFIHPKMVGNVNEYTHFVYKCHICIVGFKRRGMLVNHLANRHPDIPPETVPELNLPILKATKDYYCQYCDKIYKSSSKRKAHILKNHPGEQLPLSNRQKPSSNNKGTPDEENGTYSQTVGSVTTNPQNCQWCHKQYASKAKLLQHQRKKHTSLLPKALQKPRRSRPSTSGDENDIGRAEELEKVSDGNILLQEQLNGDISEFEVSDSQWITEGEFIIDAPTLKRALKGEMISAECLPDSIAELGQLIADSRPDQYFKVIQTSSGITFAQPIEIWDPLSSCQSLSPSDLDCSPFLTSYNAR